MRPWRAVSVGLVVALAAGCGAASRSSDAPPLPASISHQKAGVPNPAEPCGSWIGPGVDAAFCAAGQEAPSADTRPGPVTFGGTERSGSQGGIAQAVGVLPEGGTISVASSSKTHGTLIAQGLCGNVLARARFDVHFEKGERATLRITRSGETPVILLTRDGRDVPPDHELLVELDWMTDAPDGCAFRVA